MSISITDLRHGDPEDPAIMEAANLANEVQHIFDGKKIDTVINSMAFIIAEFLSSKTEEDRKAILDAFVELVRANTRFFAGEPTA